MIIIQNAVFKKSGDAGIIFKIVPNQAFNLLNWSCFEKAEGMKIT